jgi:hypothetical protein
MRRQRRLLSPAVLSEPVLAAAPLLAAAIVGLLRTREPSRGCSALRTGKRSGVVIITKSFGFSTNKGRLLGKSPAGKVGYFA